jgi:hypothetical protein
MERWECAGGMRPQPSNNIGYIAHMKSIRTIEAVYLGLAILGAALPLAAFLPWLAAHGLDPVLFIQDLFANRIAAFFGWDVIVSAVVVLIAAAAGRDGVSNGRRLGVIVGTLVIGVSFGLPLLLFFRERAKRPLGE